MTIDDGNSIYVGGLPYDIAEDELRREFDLYGSIVAVKIVNDRAVGGKCYGFVTFTNPRSATDAINDMNEKTIGGRVVKVNDVKTRGAGGRSNYGRDVFQRSERDMDRNRGRGRERVQDPNRDRYHDRSRGVDRAREKRFDHVDYDRQSREHLQDRDRSRDRDRQPREHLQDKDHNRDRDRQSREYLLDGDRSRDRDRQSRDHLLDGDSSRDRERQSRERLQDRDRSRDRDRQSREHLQDRDQTMNFDQREQAYSSGHSRERERDRSKDRDQGAQFDRVDHDREHDKRTDQKLERRSGSYDKRSRELSSGSSDYHQFEEELEMLMKQQDGIREEVSEIEERLEEKKQLVADLQKISVNLEDELTSAKKLSSVRQKQLAKLHKCYLQVKEYGDRFKSSEQELQDLAESVMLDLEAGVDFSLRDHYL